MKKIKNILMFDTSLGTRNLGDYIIRDSINDGMDYLLSNNFVVRFSTHTPIGKFKNLLKKGPILKYCQNADYKFICGTNIFKGTLFKINSDWAVDLITIPFYRNSIALGCGLGKNDKKFYGLYTKFIYKKILSKKYYHSVRDDNTKKFLESLGLKAINTGCPTMWKLTQEHCKTIPSKKAKNVIFTLTDYNQNIEADQKLINILINNYDKVYYWLQGTGDLKYLSNFKNTDKIDIIAPNLESYKRILTTGNVDYVGTRLHGGIYAMQNSVRSIIVIIDNRARDMKETYNLNTIERDNIDELEQIINSNFETRIKLNEENIRKFKNQFK